MISSYLLWHKRIHSALGPGVLREFNSRPGQNKSLPFGCTPVVVWPSAPSDWGDKRSSDISERATKISPSCSLGSFVGPRRHCRPLVGRLPRRNPCRTRAKIPLPKTEKSECSPRSSNRDRPRRLMHGVRYCSHCLCFRWNWIRRLADMLNSMPESSLALMEMFDGTAMVFDLDSGGFTISFKFIAEFEHLHV